MLLFPWFVVYVINIVKELTLVNPFLYKKNASKDRNNNRDNNKQVLGGDA